MKPFDSSHWMISDRKEGLLFFAQCLEEMLFHYGHDSLKLSALNFRSFCRELLRIIGDVDDDILDKGNIIPLWYEFEDLYCKDPIAQSLYGVEFKTFFRFKNNTGEYTDDYPNIKKEPASEQSRRKIKQVAMHLLNDMEIGSKYFNTIKSNLKNRITAGISCYDDSNEIYKLCRSLLTELVNKGYAQEYIYIAITSIFYNKHQPVFNIDDSLNAFWSHFTFEKKKYCVTLPLKGTARTLHSFDDPFIKQNSTGKFKNSKWVFENELESFDPVKAKNAAVKSLSFLHSLIQFSNHKSQQYESGFALVKDIKENKDYFLRPTVLPLMRGTNTQRRNYANQLVKIMQYNAVLRGKMIDAIELHSSAISSINVGNQLLNLWTIMEILVDTERKYSFNRINQICNTVTSVLNSFYIFSLFKQLNYDLKKCIKEKYESIIAQISHGVSEIEKLTAFLVLPEYSTLRDHLFDTIGEYPLLIYRLKYYHICFSSRNSIRKILLAHSKRIEWHIMRIYRNRNLIVHDGKHFQYIDVIVQNLHHYVDSLINIIEAYSTKGFKSPTSIFRSIQINETIYLQILDKKIDPQTEDIYFLDNFINLVLGNDYFTRLD